VKTCPRFADLRADFEREVHFLTAHAERHAGRTAAKVSTRHAASARARMARALSTHLERCPLCG
jgi:hypothetical protein